MRQGRKRKRLLAGFVLIAAVSAALAAYRGHEDASQLQEGIAEQIIRFHVRANSDSSEDQQLKMMVKEAVVTYMQPLLENSKSVGESRQILSDNIGQIHEIAVDTLRREGSSDDVAVYFENAYFPMKTYGDVTFPPGIYEAFRVDIGSHRGKNWWCVLYPPLCFVDASYGVLPQDSKDTLKNILEEDEYNAITSAQCKYRFKYLTFLNGWLDKFINR